MAEYTFKLTGWPAVVIGALVLGVSAYQLASRFQRVDDGEREALKAWLSKDYQGRGPHDLVKRVLEYRAGLPVDPVPDERPMQIEFPSLSAHGSRTIMVVRAQITVDGAPPAKGSPVRYFYLNKDAGGGWSVFTETSALSYYTALLSANQAREWREVSGR